MADEKKTSKVNESDKPKKKKSKKNPFKSMMSFFKSVKAEGKKIVWSKPKEVLKNTIVVLIVCVVAGVCIFGVDTLLSQGMKQMKKAATTTEPVSVSDQVNDDTDAEDELVADDATDDATE